MASSSKKKTTMAKLNRETAVREKRLRKQARKDARKQAAAEQPAELTDLEADTDAEPVADAGTEPVARP